MKDSLLFCSFSTIYLSFKYKVVRGHNSFEDVIREVKSKVKPPYLGVKHVLISLNFSVYFGRSRVHWEMLIHRD